MEVSPEILDQRSQNFDQILCIKISYQDFGILGHRFKKFSYWIS